MSKSIGFNGLAFGCGPALGRTACQQIASGPALLAASQFPRRKNNGRTFGYNFCFVGHASVPIHRVGRLVRNEANLTCGEDSPLTGRLLTVSNWAEHVSTGPCKLARPVKQHGRHPSSFVALTLAPPIHCRHYSDPHSLLAHHDGSPSLKSKQHVDLWLQTGARHDVRCLSN